MVRQDHLQSVDQLPGLRPVVICNEQKCRRNGSLQTDPGPRAVGVDLVQFDKRVDCVDQATDTVFADHCATLCIQVDMRVKRNATQDREKI